MPTSAGDQWVCCFCGRQGGEILVADTDGAALRVGNVAMLPDIRMHRDAIARPHDEGSGWGGHFLDGDLLAAKAPKLWGAKALGWSFLKLWGGRF